MIQRRTDQQAGQVLVLLLIVLAMAGGGVWYMFHARAQNEQAARDFAQYAAERILLAQDMKFLNSALSRDAQLMYPPSFRERLLARVRDLGAPDAPAVLVRGQVAFTNRFFKPVGSFRGEMTFSGRLAYLTFSVSRQGALWKIDLINFTWYPPPAPPPPPADLPPPPANEPRFIEEPGKQSAPANKASRRKRR
ncbi:hypothetical protein BH20VER1_BH20VER1_22020 [soil metagenome]